MNVQARSLPVKVSKAAKPVDGAEEIVGHRFNPKDFIDHFQVLSEAEGGIARLRELAIELAVQGLLLDHADPSSWRRVLLSEVVTDLQNGISKRSGDGGRALPVLRLADIERGVRIRADGLREIVLTPVEERKYRVERGDILVIRVNGSADLVGRFVPCDVSREWAYSDHLIRVRLQGDLIDTGFLCCVARSAASRVHIVTNTVTTAGQRTINQVGLGRLPLLLPPLAEQKRIVAKVDQLMALFDELETRQAKKREIRTRFTNATLNALISVEGAAAFADAWKRLVENFDVLVEVSAGVKDVRALVLHLAVQGRLLQEKPLLPEETPTNDELSVPFGLPAGWVWRRVAEVGDLKLGRQRSPKNHSGPNMRPYLRVANVYEARIDTSDVLEMNFDPNEAERFLLEPNDILLNEGQSYELVGRPAIYRGEVPGACFQNTLIRFRSSRHVLPEFALIVFRAYMRTGRFRREAQQTTNIAHLSLGRLAEIEFPLPPIGEQQRIVAKVDHLMKVCDDLEAKLRLVEGRAAKLVEAAVQELGA